MKTLSYKTLEEQGYKGYLLKEAPERMLQFGEGNFLRAFVDLKIPHIQFNVVRREDLLDAKLHPEQHRSLTIRVAGYTAYFVELAGKLQDEIIERTAYEDI